MDSCRGVAHTHTRTKLRDFLAGASLSVLLLLLSSISTGSLCVRCPSLVSQLRDLLPHLLQQTVQTFQNGQQRNCESQRQLQRQR
ncbi:unnamed protein product [Pleuronectes platessa]|uniref:Uncharacterized protein n=1 Tax=Pleuronectes platessa TaxID=8262 RepID=A0A9N7TNZ8_PLEPL|nr:unnamed protein product [Pleuronectes platessa]